MITNDRQYKISKIQIDEFRESLENLVYNKSADIHPKIFDAQRRAIESQLHDLTAEVAEYENLKSGKILITEIHKMEELPMALIKARIAKSLTQADLADILGLKMQQIQRYEAENYESASLKTLTKIAEKLEITIQADIQINTVVAPDLLNFRNYPFKQMFSRNWFGSAFESINDAVKDSPELLTALFANAGNNFQRALTKKSVRSGGTLNEFALNAWYARILTEARKQVVPKPFSKDIITSDWLRTLVALSISNDAPLRAAEYLRQSGIRFIFEPPLDGTFLDGAALLLDEKNPVIAMTGRYDRLDNFWFVLLHEVAHVYLHLNESLDAIFDDLDVDMDGIEREADQFALNALIADDVWRKSLVRFNPSDEAIINQAAALHIHPSLLAGRLRKETGKFYQFGSLVGTGEVRNRFMNSWKNN